MVAQSMSPLAHFALLACVKAQHTYHPSCAEMHVAQPCSRWGLCGCCCASRPVSLYHSHSLYCTAHHASLLLTALYMIKLVVNSCRMCALKLYLRRCVCFLNDYVYVVCSCLLDAHGGLAFPCLSSFESHDMHAGLQCLPKSTSTQGQIDGIWVQTQHGCAMCLCYNRIVVTARWQS